MKPKFVIGTVVGRDTSLDRIIAEWNDEKVLVRKHRKNRKLHAGDDVYMRILAYSTRSHLYIGDQIGRRYYERNAIQEGSYAGFK